MKSLQGRLFDARKADQYSDLFVSIMDLLPSPTLQKVWISWIGSLQWIDKVVADNASRRRMFERVKLARMLFGSLAVSQRERWDVFSGVILGRVWPEDVAPFAVLWAANDDNTISVERSYAVCSFWNAKGDVSLILGLTELVNQCLEVWTSPQYVKYATLSRHRCQFSLRATKLTLLKPTS